MNIRMWFRSAITGRFVKQQEAQASPDTTVSHRGIFEDQSDQTEAPPEIWDGKIWYPLGRK